MTEFSAIPKAYDLVAKLTGENFNIFQILRVGNSEVRTHSAFLGELLNCKGTHGQNNLFLKLFVEHFKIENFDYTTSEISLEHYAGAKTIDEGGRIDIFICDKDKNCIIIENKIYAGDQENQMLRYYNYGGKFKSAKLFYLTLWEQTPAEWSIGELSITDYQCISYAEGIRDWLYSCQKEATNFPILRESISQYINLIKSLTNQTSYHNMNNEIVKGIFSSPEKLDAYLTLVGNKEVEYEIYDTILQNFKVQLEEVAKELNLKFTFWLNRNDVWTGFTFDNDTMNKYNVHIGFQFGKKYTQDFFFGFAYTDMNKKALIATPDKIDLLFKSEFGQLPPTEWWPCHVWHEHKNWGIDTYKMVQSGEMTKIIKMQVEKMLEIIASIDKNPNI